MTNINYTYNDSEGAPSLVEPGTYAVKAVKFETGFTSNNNDKITLHIQIKEGPIAYENIIFTEKAMWKMDIILKAFSASKKLPLPSAGKSVKIDDEFMLKYIIGGIAKAEIVVHEYNGKKSNRVSNWIVPSELPAPIVEKMDKPSPTDDFDLSSDEEEDDVPF